MGKTKEEKNRLYKAIAVFCIPVLIRFSIGFGVNSDAWTQGSAVMISRLLIPGLSALSMHIFLHRQEEVRSQWILSACSIAYGLSSFCLLQSRDPGSSLVIPVFPILYYLYDKIRDLKHRIAFTIFMAVLFLMAPSFGLGLCTVLVVTAVGKKFLLRGQKETEDSRKESIWITIRTFLISAGLAAFSWLPGVYQHIMQGKWAGWNDDRFYMSWSGLLSRFFVMSGDGAKVTSGQAVNLYCGVLVVFFFGLYLFSADRTVGKKTASVFGIVAIMLLCNIRPFYNLVTFYTDEGKGADLFCIVPVFLVLKAVALADEKSIKAIPYKKLFLFFFEISVLFFFVSRFAINVLTNESVFATLVVIVAAMIFVVLYRSGSIKDSAFCLGFFLLVVAELTINVYDISHLDLPYAMVKEDITAEAIEDKESEEITWDPFLEKRGRAPEDLQVSSGLPQVSVKQYKSGIVALDTHKVALGYPTYVVTYRFTAKQDGILYLKHGDTVTRYGSVHTNDLIAHKTIHTSDDSSVEYEYFQVYYADKQEEQAALDSVKIRNKKTDYRISEGKKIAFILGAVLSILTTIGLLIFGIYPEKLPEFLQERGGNGKQRKAPMWLVAFLIPFSILLLACVFAGIAPFGENTMWHGDGVAVTMPTMFQARDQIFQGEYLYSFSAGGGSNLYYINPVLALFLWMAAIPEHLLAKVVGIIILIKIALSGSSLYLYLSGSRKHKTKLKEGSDIVLLTLTTAYALSSFQLCMTSDFYWSDVVFVLPILLLMMERMLFEKRNVGYCLALTMEMIFNCYNTIYICLFLLLWFFTFSFEDLKDFLKKGAAFLMNTVLAAGMGFWVIYATYLSGRYVFWANKEYTFTAPRLMQSFWITLRQFFLMADPVSEISTNGMINLYCGIFVIILFFISIFVLGKRRNYRYRIGISLIILLSTNVSTLDDIWNGFQYDNNMLGKYAFLLVFLMMDIAWDVINEIRENGLERKPMIASLVTAVVVGVLSAWLGRAELSSIIWTAVLFFAYVVCMILPLEKGTGLKNMGVYVYVVLGIALLEICINTCFVFSRIAEQHDFYAYRDATKWLEEYDPDLSDLDRVAFLGSENANQGECGDVGSYGMLSTLITPSQSDFSRFLGMNVTENAIVDSSNLTPISNAFGRVKYILVNRWLEATGIDLEDYTVIGEVNGILILKNKNVIPEGLWISSELMWHLNAANDREEFFNTLTENYTNGGKVFDLAVPMRKLNAQSEYQEEENAFFVNDNKGGAFADTKLFLNTPGTGTYYFEGDSYAYLGELDGGEKKQLSGLLPQSETASLVRFDKEVFDVFIRKIREKGLNDAFVSDGRIVGEYKTSEAGYLCFPVPYDEGWRAIVNNKRGELVRMRNGMMAVKVNKGENEISLTFIPVGFVTGIMITYLSFMILFLLQIFSQHRNRVKNRQGSLLLSK